MVQQFRLLCVLRNWKGKPAAKLGPRRTASAPARAKEPAGRSNTEGREWDARKGKTAHLRSTRSSFARQVLQTPLHVGGVGCESEIPGKERQAQFTGID
uniref:Uncharacterized protein n=1 Tax=Dromaius novaehollandiae TaxID=8790 RepID=A0A8C4K1A2_DRONO